ncbi:hypothetical protein V8C44DRAFT_236206 [Trichoderma aethiopicum]
MNNLRDESPESPTPPSNQYSAPNRALSVGSQDGANSPPSGKLFSRDRGLPRSNSAQTSQLWPPSRDGSAGLIHDCMISCPDLNHPAGQRWGNARQMGRWQRRCSRSQPTTPPSFRERMAVRFRRRRPWDSPRTFRGFTSAQLDIPRFQDGRERRRRAQESLERHSPSDLVSPHQSPAAGARAASPLVAAGIMLATVELDRLSRGERRDEGEEVCLWGDARRLDC